MKMGALETGAGAGWLGGAGGAAGGIEVIEPDWPAPAQVRAVFTLRRGGVSRPPYDSLNLGLHTGDDPAAVIENRRRVREALRLPREPAWLTQVHGTVVARLDDVASASPTAGTLKAGSSTPGAPAADSLASGMADISRAYAAIRADAALTRAPCQICAIQVADCLPVLFAARDGSAVAAAHAGWRGLAGGVLEATVAALGAEPYGIVADQLVAWMGPAIGPRHFEVGDEAREAFLARDGGAEAAFTPNARGRWQCDLYALARRRLEAVGVRQVYGGGWCTYADPARFYSYRRDGRCGRMAALVWIGEAS